MVIINDALDLTQFYRLKSTRARPSNGFKPELCFSTLFADMNVRSLIEISLIKPELVTLAAQDNRHMVSRQVL